MVPIRTIIGMSKEVIEMEKMALGIERGGKSFTNPFIEGQLSEHTRRAYRGDVAAFVAFVEAQREQAIADLDQVLPTIQKDEILAFRNAMAKGGYSPSTINRRLSTVRQLFEDGKERGIVEHNVTKKVRGLPDSWMPRSSALTSQEAQALLDAPDTTTLLGKRDKVMLGLMLLCGLRVSEVVGLTPSQISMSYSHHVLCFMGKGKKRATVKIPEPLMDLIEEYKQGSALAGRPIGRNDPLFVHIAKRQEDDGVQYLPASDKALSTRAVAKLVKRYANQVGLDPETIHPHVLRHTFVTLAIDGGAKVFRVQRAARHASVTTTQRYYSPKEDLEDNPSDYILEHVKL
jgi:integrase/recombinase XerD